MTFLPDSEDNPKHTKFLRGYNARMRGEGKKWRPLDMLEHTTITGEVDFVEGFEAAEKVVSERKRKAKR